MHSPIASRWIRQVRTIWRLQVLIRNKIILAAEWKTLQIVQTPDGRPIHSRSLQPRRPETIPGNDRLQKLLEPLQLQTLKRRPIQPRRCKFNRFALHARKCLFGNLMDASHSSVRRNGNPFDESYSTLHHCRKSSPELAISEARRLWSNELPTELLASTSVKFGPFCILLATALLPDVNS